MMLSLEEQVKDMQETNKELVLKLQHWKMIAAERENDKLQLMKEASELRLKLSMLRNNGAADARKFDAEIQSASEAALSHLVQASNAVARIIELAKTYMQDRENVESTLPRWSNLSNAPSAEKVHRVPPMMFGGRSIQPVVSLSRTLLTNNIINNRPENSIPNPSLNGLRPMPMHMLQDVYIPLTRIDVGDRNTNNGDREENVNNSTEDLHLDDSDERITEEPNISEGVDFDNSRRLHVVTEESEENDITPQRNIIDNPLEGPSWLLDEPNVKVNMRRSRNRTSVEPNIMEYEELPPNQNGESDEESGRRSAFTPTVRRKRTSSPHAPSPVSSPVFLPLRRRCRNNGRILKVLVAKMRLDDDEDVSPPKRVTMGTPAPISPRQSTSQETKSHVLCPNVRQGSKQRDISQNVRQPQVPRCSVEDERHSRCSKSQDSQMYTESHSGSQDSPETSRDKRLDRFPSFDAPSPNGSTDARVIVSDTACAEPVARRINRHNSECSAHTNSDTVSDSSGNEMLIEMRTRRAKKPIVYKEKPLNRKLRR